MKSTFPLRSLSLTLLATGALMTACGHTPAPSGPAPTGSSRPSNNAESACMSGVNARYDGNVKTVKVLSSEFSQANSVVMILAEGVRGGSTNERWRCLVSNTGQVQELRVQR